MTDSKHPLSDRSHSRPRRESETTYGQRYNCSNCGYSGTVDIPKGQPNTTRICPVCDYRSYSKKGSMVTAKHSSSEQSVRENVAEALEELANLMRQGAVYQGNRRDGRNDDYEYGSFMFKWPREGKCS